MEIGESVRGEDVYIIQVIHKQSCDLMFSVATVRLILSMLVFSLHSSQQAGLPLIYTNTGQHYNRRLATGVRGEDVYIIQVIHKQSCDLHFLFKNGPLCFY